MVVWSSPFGHYDDWLAIRPLSGHSGLSPSSTLGLVQAPFIAVWPRLCRRSFLCVAAWQCLPAVAASDRCCCLAIVRLAPLFGCRSIQPFRQLRLRLLSSHRQPSFPLHRPVVDLAPAVMCLCAFQKSIRWVPLWPLLHLAIGLVALRLPHYSRLFCPSPSPFWLRFGCVFSAASATF